MNDFKHSILTLMHAALDSRKITKVQYAPDQSLLPSYDELILSPHLFETESIFLIEEIFPTQSICPWVMWPDICFPYFKGVSILMKSPTLDFLNFDLRIVSFDK